MWADCLECNRVFAVIAGTGCFKEAAALRFMFGLGYPFDSIIFRVSLAIRSLFAVFVQVADDRWEPALGTSVF